MKPQTTTLDETADHLMDRLTSICCDDDMKKFQIMRSHILEVLAEFQIKVSDATRVQQVREIMQHE